MDFIELKKNIERFNNKDIVNEIPEPVYSDKTKGNTYELSQFNWKIRSRNYRQNLKDTIEGIKRRETKEISSINDIQQLMEREEFGKKWSKLTKNNKLLKLREYLDNLDIKREHRNKIKTYAYTEFNKGALNNKNVKYDMENYKICEIVLIIKKLEDINKNDL